MNPKDHRLETCATEKKLAGPEYFDCGPFSARISARQCLLNQGKARGLKVFGTRYMGRERVCLECPEGRRMQAYPPGGVPAPQPPRVCLGQAPPAPLTKSPLTPLYQRGEEGGERAKESRPKRLPAWLKNASAAVRRDYLKEQEKVRLDGAGGSVGYDEATGR